VSDGYEREDDVDGLLNEAEKKILEVSHQTNAKAFQNIKDVLVDAYDKIELLHNQKGEVTGIPTGFTELDKMTDANKQNVKTAISNKIIQEKVQKEFEKQKKDMGVKIY